MRWNRQMGCRECLRATSLADALVAGERNAGMEDMMDDSRLEIEALSCYRETEPETLPLAVVPDWDEQVRRATHACRLIDRHLDYEIRRHTLQDGEEFAPRRLCPEQRVQMVTDLYAITRYRGETTGLR